MVWEDILIEGSQWAYPAEESFKKQLRNVYKNIDLYKNRSKTLKNIIQKNFSKENIYQKMQDAIFSKHQDKEEDEILVL
jgi:phosphopantetheine adenylyltransferase